MLWSGDRSFPVAIGKEPKNEGATTPCCDLSLLSKLPDIPCGSKLDGAVTIEAATNQCEITFISPLRRAPAVHPVSSFGVLPQRLGQGRHARSSRSQAGPAKPEAGGLLLLLITLLLLA